MNLKDPKLPNRVRRLIKNLDIRTESQLRNLFLKGRLHPQTAYATQRIYWESKIPGFQLHKHDYRHVRIGMGTYQAIATLLNLPIVKRTHCYACKQKLPV